jgi:hypothetical protein
VPTPCTCCTRSPRCLHGRQLTSLPALVKGRHTLLYSLSLISQSLFSPSRAPARASELAAVARHCRWPSSLSTTVHPHSSSLVPHLQPRWARFSLLHPVLAFPRRRYLAVAGATSAVGLCAAAGGGGKASRSPLDMSCSTRGAPPSLVRPWTPVSSSMIEPAGSAGGHLLSRPFTCEGRKPSPSIFLLFE